MHIKHIHCMIEKLSKCAKCEFEKGIEQVDTKEMGEVVDILKDLCEAEYYSKISKAMDEHKEDDDDEERRYYRGQPRDSRGRYMSRGRRGYEEPPHYHMTPEMYKEHSPEWYRDMDKQDGRMYYTETQGTRGTTGGRDMREGRSGQSRRSYMETKEMHKANTPADKQAKMKELENYAKELSEDVTEMILDATPEERNLVKTKLQTLAQKIQ